MLAGEEHSSGHTPRHLAALSLEEFVQVFGARVEAGDQFTFYQIHCDLVRQGRLVSFEIVSNAELDASYVAVSLRQPESSHMNLAPRSYRVVPSAANTPLQPAQLLRIMDQLGGDHARSQLLSDCFPD